MTLANKVTILRIILIPFFIIALLQKWEWTVLLYIPIMASDCADGLIARLKNQRTALGAFLDPLADRFLLIFAFFTLGYQGLVPRWMFVLVLSRDFIVVLGWFLLFLITDKKDVFPRLSGKIAVILQMFLVLFVLVNPSAVGASSIGFIKIAFYLTAAATAFSMVDYAAAGIKKFGKYV